MKKVQGYVLDVPNGNPISGVPVTIYKVNGATAVTSTDAFGASANPINTDANGFFSWVADLSPGDVYAEAVVSGGQIKRRYGKELMQSGLNWLGDLSVFGEGIDGIIQGILNEMAPTFSGGSNQVTIATGHGIVRGHPWTLESAAFTLNIAANNTMASRLSYVVFRQYLTGSDEGKQVIDIVYGTVTGVLPALHQSTDYWEYPVCSFSTANGAVTSVLVTDLRVFHSGLRVGNETGATIADKVSRLEFDSAAFNTTSPATGSARVAPQFGTGAGNLPRGNHEHTLFTGDVTFAARIIGAAANNAVKFIYDGATGITGVSATSSGGANVGINLGAGITLALDSAQTYDIFCFTYTSWDATNLPSGTTFGEASAAIQTPAGYTISNPPNIGSAYARYNKGDAGTVQMFRLAQLVTSPGHVAGITGVSTIGLTLYFNPYTNGNYHVYDWFYGALAFPRG